MQPYEQNQIDDNIFIRIFHKDMPEEALKWHWDEEDRIIEPLEETDWLFQFDNDLPQPMNGQIYIPKGLIHRIIKGTGDFRVRVIKIF